MRSPDAPTEMLADRPTGPCVTAEVVCSRSSPRPARNDPDQERESSSRDRTSTTPPDRSPNSAGTCPERTRTAPIAAGFLFRALAQRRAKKSYSIVPREHFWHALWFTFGWALVRFLYARRD